MTPDQHRYHSIRAAHRSRNLVLNLMLGWGPSDGALRYDDRAFAEVAGLFQRIEGVLETGAVGDASTKTFEQAQKLKEPAQPPARVLRLINPVVGE